MARARKTTVTVESGRGVFMISVDCWPTTAERWPRS